MVDNGLPLDKDEAYGVLKTIIRQKVQITASTLIF